MSLLQLEDPLVGETINATLASLVLSDTSEIQPTAPFSRTIADPVRGSIRTTDFQVGSDGEGYGSAWQDCRYIYNPSAVASNGIVSVWSIINDVSGGNVGDVYFRQNVFVDKNVSVSGQLIAPNFSFANALPKNNFVMTVPGGTIPTGALTNLAQPASLPAGTYCIMLQVNGRQAFNISTFARWNGISWSAGGSSMTEDVANGGAKAILNSNGIALQFYHEAGAPITLDYVYYYGIGTN